MMTTMEIARRRLHNQQIAQASFETPGDVVQWLGAVQAQDFPGALWAVGLRMRHATDVAVEQAWSEGTILRTHVMRPTWHFVTPADIRWMLALTAPRVKVVSAYAYRTLALDETVCARSNALLAEALSGGKQMTRSELAVALQQGGIATDDPRRLTYLIMRAELDGVVCSGTRRGKQFTYALLDERAPGAEALARDEALAELTRRYFTGHGPATLRDYLWWSGLTTADVRRGLEMVKAQLTHALVEGETYWFADSPPAANGGSHTAYLLPNFDEYTVGYRDRRAVFAASHTENLDARESILAHHTMVYDGRIIGIWRRTFKNGTVNIAASPFTPLNGDETRAFAAAAERYGTFVHMPVALSFL